MDLAQLAFEIGPVAVYVVAAALGLYALVVCAPESRLLFTAILLTSGGCAFHVFVTLEYLANQTTIMETVYADRHWVLMHYVRASGAAAFHLHHILESKGRASA